MVQRLAPELIVSVRMPDTKMSMQKSCKLYSYLFALHTGLAPENENCLQQDSLLDTQRCDSAWSILWLYICMEVSMLLQHCQTQFRSIWFPFLTSSPQKPKWKHWTAGKTALALHTPWASGLLAWQPLCFWNVTHFQFNCTLLCENHIKCHSSQMRWWKCWACFNFCMQIL